MSDASRPFHSMCYVWCSCVIQFSVLRTRECIALIRNRHIFMVPMFKVISNEDLTMLTMKYEMSENLSHPNYSICYCCTVNGSIYLLFTYWNLFIWWEFSLQRSFFIQNETNKKVLVIISMLAVNDQYFHFHPVSILQWYFSETRNECLTNETQEKNIK